MTSATLEVTSHVSRDLLQSAALFKHEHSVVWEYVSNGLEYLEPGINPTVHVTVDIKAKKITVRDNGRGMSLDDLGRYFQMHGENIDRKQGKPGRGFFGTGKSAAFGIADLLRVTTSHNGKRSKVQLTRDDIENKSDGTSIPVQILEGEGPCQDSNGTVVEIEGIQLKKIDVGSITRHIERHIAHWPNASVFVNHHECQFVDPPVAQEHHFSSKGTPFEAALGEAELIIKVAKAPLEEELQGIAILTNGNWQETTLSGCDGKPVANYIFGTVEIPKLATDQSPIPAFDMSRSMRLNPKNELVGQIYAFIGMHLEPLRRELEKQDRERRKADEARKLQKEAEAIAELINEDFNSWRDQVRKVAARASGKSDTLPHDSPDLGKGMELVFGDDEPATIVEEIGGTGHGSGESSGGGGDPHAAPIVGEGNDQCERKGKRAADPKQQKTRKGGFLVDFLNMGADEARAKYERDDRTIYINLEHPQIAKALGTGGIKDPIFLRLAYEVAFSEYAVALASEMAAVGYYIDVTEPIFDIRDTLNRLSKMAASQL